MDSDTRPWVNSIHLEEGSERERERERKREVGGQINECMSLLFRNGVSYFMLGGY